MASPCRTPPPRASLSPSTMHDPSDTPAELLTKSRLAKDQGWQWLTAWARHLERRAQAQAAQDTNNQMSNATTNTEPPPMAT